MFSLDIFLPHCCLLCACLNADRYLRGLMGTFNERAEKLMDRLSEEADNQTVAHMLNLVNCVTLDVIAKVLRLRCSGGIFVRLC